MKKGSIFSVCGPNTYYIPMGSLPAFCPRFLKEGRGSSHPYELFIVRGEVRLVFPE